MNALIPSQVPQIMANVYAEMSKDEMTNRLKIYRMLRSVYDGDKEEVIKDIYNELLQRKLYSQQTLNQLLPRYKNYLPKILSRYTAGIYDVTPTYTINGETDKTLEKLLIDIKYIPKIKEAMRKSLYFGVTETYIRYYKGKDYKGNMIDKFCLDVLSPDVYNVNVSDNDYLEKSDITIACSRTINDIRDLYFVYWNDYEHYEIDNQGIKRPIGDNLNMVNPYGVIPTATLRFEEGLSYWGEPDWELYDLQITNVLRLINNIFAEQFQAYGIWTAINMNLKEGQVFSPNNIIEINKVTNDMVLPSIQNIKPKTNWEEINSITENDIKNTLRNKGISSASASTDQQPAQSGTAKTIDEIELQEIRNDKMTSLYYFEIDLLNRIREVYNTFSSNKIPDGEIDVQYNKAKPYESIDDKIKRREHEKKYFIKSDIDFIMEDYEITEDKAMKIYDKNKAFTGTINTDDTPDETENNDEDNSEDENKV